MDLHPYDGSEQRYRHTDVDQTTGLAAVARILGLPAPPASDRLQYDLSFYSGGIGVLDKLAMALAFDEGLWSMIITGLGARAPDDLDGAGDEGEDFRWLMLGDADQRDIRVAAAEFIESNRASFQSPCSSEEEILFTAHSNVNDWTAIWRGADVINLLEFNQG